MEESIHKKLEESRMVCQSEIPIHQQRLNHSMISFQKSLQSIKLNAEQTSQDQVKLGELKTHLRELENDLVKALAVKTRGEAKRMAITDSIYAAKARIEELKRVIQDQRERKEKYAAVISQQLLSLTTLEEKSKEGIKHKEDIDVAISWYNEVLGLRIEGGCGVKFIFNKINLKNPKEEYSFTIRHANDTYTLLDCDPYLGDTQELIRELNHTNGLFKFVRIMREKFQAAASLGTLHEPTSIHPDSSTVSISAPAPSISIDGSESSAKENDLQNQPGELNRPPKKVNRGRAGKMGILSPESASSYRRSPRFKVKK